MPAFRLVPDQSWPTLGWGVVDWIESYLCHGPGDIEGDPIVLDDEFAQFILDCYRVYPEGHAQAGRRVVTDAELSRPKGRAKSELAGMLVCAEALGPVRFSHWGPDGTPVGKPVRSPFIRCLATEETQTGNTYDNVTTMLRYAAEKFPDLFPFGVKDIGFTRVIVPGGGEIVPSTAAGSSKDGGKETFAVADEIHLYDRPELHRMFQVVKRNCRKRKAAQPWMLSTTTQFEPGAGSVAELNRDEAEQQLDRRRKRRPSFLWDHREGTPVDDWSDDKAVMASLVEAYGLAAEWMDLESILQDEIRAHTTTESEARRYWLNMRATGEHKPIDLQDWDKLADPTRNPTDGDAVLLAFDGSDHGAISDDTVITGWVVDERPHLFFVRKWSTDRTPTYRVPRLEVQAEMRSLFDRYRVVRLVADPPYWREQVDEWDAEHGVDHNGDPIVLAFYTAKPAQMGPAIDRFLEAVREGNFTHDGSPEMRDYVSNMILTKARGSGDYKAVLKEKQDRKIDGAVTAIIGYAELAHVDLSPVPVMASPEVVIL